MVFHCFGHLIGNLINLILSLYARCLKKKFHVNLFSSLIALIHNIIFPFWTKLLQVIVDLPNTLIDSTNLSVWLCTNWYTSFSKLVAINLFYFIEVHDDWSYVFTFVMLNCSFYVCSIHFTLFKWTLKYSHDISWFFSNMLC